MTLQEQIAAYRPCNEQEESDKRLMLQYFTIFDDLLTRKNETMHFTASAWVVSPDRKRVLMAFHNLYQSWAWLGGHADGESDLLAVALREVREESGLEALRIVKPDIYSLEILGVDAHRKRGRHVSTHLHLNATYLFEADDTLPVRVKPDENSGVQWFAASDVIKVVREPEMRVIYQKLLDKMA